MTLRRLSIRSLLQMSFFLLVAASALTAYCDSLELRDGRHLHGKYVGGTTTDISFMADGIVQRIAVSDVLLLVFGDMNVEAPLGISSGAPRLPESGFTRALRRTASIRPNAPQTPERHPDLSKETQSHARKTQVSRKAHRLTPPLKTI
jgi:hypothetical protein